MREPYARKPACTVLGGQGGSNAFLLPDVRHEVADVTAVLEDTAPCSARGFLPQRASLATAGCEACGTM